MTRVLIVDDEPENLGLLRVILQGRGCAVDEARHGAEALAKARTAPPRLVISDLLMPVMDGYTLLRQWKADERLKAIPFVVYTATYTGPGDERLALDLGADAFIPKPTEHERFMARIREVVANAWRDELQPPRAPQAGEEVLLKEHNEVLIRKLGAKAAELEAVNRAWRVGISERERAERERDRLLEEGQRDRQQLEALPRRLVVLQEEERRAIARELHDQIGQLLTGLKLLAESGRGRDELLEVVGELIGRVRSISLDLRPPMLDNLGLLPALLWHVDRYTAQTGVRVDLREVGHRRRYSSDTEIAAFRIVQEALTNVARHAGVREASIEVEVGDERLRLRVEDQGSGFERAHVLAGTGIGLTGMQERARLLGGRFSIDSRPGRGTRVEVELPATDRGPAA